MTLTESQKEYQRRRYQDNSEMLKAKQRLYTRNNPEKVLLTQSRIRAKRRGLDHTISIEDIRIPSICPVLGIQLNQGGNTDSSPSLDRIDSSKGYTPDNVWVISTRANRIKNDATPDELIQLVRALTEKATHGLHSVSTSPMEVIITPGTY
jgi:hypothetical protein